jgi:phosphate transport system protein
MKKFEQELEQLKAQVGDMGAVAESMVAWSAEALLARRMELADRVLAEEPRVDRFQIDIEGEVIRLITIYSPTARDLRFLLMVARISTELERIADQAVNNCEFVRELLAQPPPAARHDLSRMSNVTRAMVHEALEAFRDEDTERAERVRKMDDEVDALNGQTVRDLLGGGAADPGSINVCMTLSLLARSIERIADHATNICEEVIYMVRGEDVRHQG